MRKWIYLILSLGAFCQVLAEEIPITLNEARSRALQNNPLLKQTILDERAARWGMLRAVSDALPHISFNSVVIRSDDESVFRQNIMRDVILQEYGQYIHPEDFPPFAYKDMYSSSISLDQPIYNGGVEITALRIAATRKKMIQLTQEIQTRETKFQAEIAYYNLCRAYQAHQVQKNALSITKGYLERYKRREELGLISSTDLLRWEVQAADDEAALVETENAWRLAELSLARMMGSVEFESYYPTDLEHFLSEDSSGTNTNLLSLDDLWELTKGSSPDLQIVRRSVDLEKKNVWLASANFQPKLNFNYTYSWEADNDWQLDGFESWTASINLRMPLFASFGNIARWQEARINVKRAQEGLRDSEIILRLQLTTAYSNHLTAQAKLNSANKMLKQGREVLKAQEKRYDEGLITTLELLDARNGVLFAQLNQINARFDRFIAEANLLRITGEKAIK